MTEIRYFPRGVNAMNHSTRRDFLSKVAGLSAALTFPRAASARRQTRKRPNVLFIIADDLNDAVAGMGGHPGARTPNINRIHKVGVRFTNAQCNAPICGPSRASLWTGIYPHTSGYYGYAQQENRWREFPALKHATTMMEHFRQQGYLVGGTGKIFHNGHEDNSVWSKIGSISGSGIKPDFGPWPWDGTTKRWNMPSGRGHPLMPPPLNRNRWASFGPLSNVPVYDADPERGINGFEGWILYGAPYHYASETDRDRMPDELNAAWAAERLVQRHDAPFFMAVGMNRPHAPRYAPQEFFDLFPLERVQLPPYKVDDLRDCAPPLWQNPSTGKRKRNANALNSILNSGGQELWKKWIQSYLACTAFVDHQIGKVLDALWNGPHAEDTIVVLASDHGHHMGEKDHMEKRTVWEEVSRIPLILSAPGVTRAGTQCDHPVSLVDLYPTLCDLCALPGLQEAKVLDGHSLRPFLKDPAATQWGGPPVALSTLHGDVHLARNEPGKMDNQHFSVRSKRYRYIRCGDGSEELYDHKTDPNEWNNIAAQASYAAELSWHREQMQLLLSGENRTMAPKATTAS